MDDAGIPARAYRRVALSGATCSLMTRIGTVARTSGAGNNTSLAVLLTVLQAWDGSLQREHPPPQPAPGANQFVSVDRHQFDCRVPAPVGPKLKKYTMRLRQLTGKYFTLTCSAASATIRKTIPCCHHCCDICDMYGILNSGEIQRRAVRDERRAISEREHVSGHQQRITPAVRLALDDTECGQTLRRKHIPGQQ
jgi:hypothetical protein